MLTMDYAFLLPAAFLSLSLFSYERTLIPMYATVPTNQYLQHFLFLAVTLSVYLRPQFRSASRKYFFSGSILALAPNATYYFAAWSARQRNPVWGPVFVHAFALVPIIYAYGVFLPSSTRGMLSVWGTLISSFVLSKRLWPVVTSLRTISDSQIYLSQALVLFAIGVLQLDLSSPTHTTKAPKRPASSKNRDYAAKGTLLTVVLTLAFTPLTSWLRSPVLQHPYPETYTHPSFPLQIHSAVESTTGLIIVGEALEPAKVDPLDMKAMHSVRYLRAAHSILGGVWMGKRVHTIDGFAPVKDSHGSRLGDSIYGAFNLQEAARLVERGEKKKGKRKALIIGLGAGISATALHRHGLNLTVLEIDPAVYTAARRFFGFPDPGEENVFLEDAGRWVTARANQIKAGDSEDDASLYDIALHDCFSGGGVPQHLYEIEFLENLKKIVKPDGVIVINYAGIVDSEPSRLLLRTLDEAFPQCRAFHDLVMADALKKEEYDSQFVNVVFFCTMRPDTPITFRKSDMTDYLGSHLRKHMMTTLKGREVDLDILRKSMERIEQEEGRETKILTKAHNPLGRMQNEQAAKHWTVMREVLPDVHWETF
ncbi:S-adenosyl-L-methionine-dependent methyltransferase [Marasmius fiardii PR-910]|nr:S-adenosyl-L-methionine-dependent methyltransferase [Marasmius fiardii PR-910]